MAIALEAKKALTSLNLPGLDVIYANGLPADPSPLIHKTVGLVTEVGFQFVTPGGNDWHEREDEIQVQVFYGIGAKVDPDDLEMKIIRGLKAQGYRVASGNAPHTVDPDTKQFTATYKFMKTKGS